MHSASCLAVLALIGAGAASPLLSPNPEIRGTEEPTPRRGEVLLADEDGPILRYLACTVPLPEGYLEQVAEGSHIYARPRSGYLHPLYGLDGVPLTLDWSTDHPHHRGIYWAWPEVGFGEEIADLHALQRVFSRSVGEPRVTRTPEHSRIEARNLWIWEDEVPVVFETVTITTFPLTDDGTRIVDLDLRFEALTDGITLARRDTNLYGGLNVRLAPVEGLAFGHHADAEAAPVRRAWSTATGTWAGSEMRTTFAILEHPTNPDYPGDWITYEYLPWFQPTFPRADTRFALRRGEPLSLRYRFLVLPGETDFETLTLAWDAYASPRPSAEERER
jgi:hypothetical protein